MKFTYFRNRSLQIKFILITSFAVIILMLILGYTMTKRARNIMYRDVERQGMILAESLAIPVTNALLYERIGFIEEGGLIDSYISEIFENRDIELIYLLVLDEKGRVIAHNDFDEYGKVYEDPITVNALASDATVIQKFYESRLDHQAIDVSTPLSIGKKRWGTLKFGLSLERVDNEMNSIISRIIIFTLLLLSAGFIIILLLSRRFISPITELAETMEKAGGDRLDVKVDVRGDDEIALLGRSFNRMIERIRKSNYELKQTYEQLREFARAIEETGGNTLDTKVTIQGVGELAFLIESYNRMMDRIGESSVQLKETHEKLLQSQKLASIGILASGVAHEINNPLGGMFNCVQMLEQMGESKESRKRYLELLKIGLNRIETTIGKLLWMSRKEEKKPQAVEIKRSLEDVYGFIEYKIKKNNIAYSEHVEESVSVLMDPHDIQQVLINLMNNAVQSMRNGGMLTIHAYTNNTKVILEVSDSGEGIDGENLNKIFDPFYTTKQPGEGTGLGLWLTYEIVKSYDGEISVHSKRGEGSTFTIQFNRLV